LVVAAAFHGKQSRVAGERRRIVFFAAERTAGFSLNHADFVFG
jgi:hypothetical protein